MSVAKPMEIKSLVLMDVSIFWLRLRLPMDQLYNKPNTIASRKEEVEF